MNGSRALVRPLEDDWRDAIDAVARARSWPTSRDVAKLGARVAELSRAYNDPSRARAAMAEAGAARLGFSFARDVPKGAGAVRELVATGALRMPADRPLRVLDLGAGLGATTWGLARALEAAGAAGVIEATWLDTDAQALDLGAALVRARQTAVTSPIRLDVTTRIGSVGMTAVLDRFDVVLLGQVLSELEVALTEDERRADHAELLRALVEDRIELDGAVVVIEPALRDRTRHLHRVRDAVLAEAAAARAAGSEPGAESVTLFAPCLHEGPCPALARESDWCHEDLSVDLPAWLVPVARAAGLRHEGLTFSYLVLRRRGPRLVDAIAMTSPSESAATAVRLRVVSEAIRTKGKREAFVCGELMQASGLLDASATPMLAPGRVRLMRLDRDANPGNAAWERITRGDLLVVAPPPALERPRIGSTSSASHADVRDRLEQAGSRAGVVPTLADPASGRSESR
jgi:ribosomal protein RSM22 (predicted rRNA methylase)